MSAIPSPLKSPTLGVQPARFPSPMAVWTVPFAFMSHTVSLALFGETSLE